MDTIMTNTVAPFARIEITSMSIDVRNGTSQRTGNAYSIRSQIAYLHQEGVPYPTMLKINLEENASPYQIGMYDLDSSSLVIGRYDDLQLKPVLKPIPQAIAPVKKVG